MSFVLLSARPRKRRRGLTGRLAGQKGPCWDWMRGWEPVPAAAAALLASAMLVMQIASKDEGPGRLIGVEPRALDAQRLGRRLCRAVMPRRPGAVQCCRGGGIGAARGACDLPALQLLSLPQAGMHLRTVRLREPILPR